MHGEYKVPGGKLVVVDVDVVDGLLRNVRVSGDFFLEPEEAHEAITRSLDGASADLDAGGLAGRIEAALPPGAVLLGFSAQAVGIAVRRALTRAAEWEAYDWHLVHEAPQDPALHMALDEVLTREVAEERRKPTLRIWEWARSAVVIGTFQSVGNEVDLEAARRHDIDVVRRISGGGAMFIEPGNTITYSLYVPSVLVQGMSYIESYAFLDDWVVAALGELGIKAWYQPINDITSDIGKIGGAAQKRLASGGVLHHATMAYDIDADKMVEVLRIGREKISDKGIGSANKRVDPIRRQTGLPRDAVIERMVGTFRRRYGLTEDRLRPSEIEAAKELVREKYSTKEWLHRVP
ncbi:MAG TPA: biotin/lipoate A/B protein ligase family protein [Actinopolymorphaceae bacterium]